MFNPKTGKLFLKINIDTVNAIQDVAAALCLLPVGERPKTIFLDVNKGIIDHQDKLDQDFPNIVMKGSELKLPFQACLKVEKFTDHMKLKANSTDLFSFNFYDDWLKTISSYIAFNRIVLIFRALDVNIEEAKELLKPAEADHIWPSLSEADWVGVEVALRKIILKDYAVEYCQKKGYAVNTTALKPSEIRDIIFLGAH